jgi:hypothetical protein
MVRNTSSRPNCHTKINQGGVMEKRKILKNAPFNCDPTIAIKEGDLMWETAYANWIAGFDSTDNIEWKKGIFLGWISDGK